VRDLRLSTVGAVCALLTVAGFVAGIALMATSGVQLLIPETGSAGAEWVAEVNDAGDAFVAGAGSSALQDSLASWRCSASTTI
jgi:hypothetical protein